MSLELTPVVEGATADMSAVAIELNGSAIAAEKPSAWKNAAAYAGAFAAFNITFGGIVMFLEMSSGTTSFVWAVPFVAVVTVIGLPILIAYVWLERQGASLEEEVEMPDAEAPEVIAPPTSRMPHLVTTPLLEAPAEGRKTHVFSISNQKGGVGKTTTAINLATAFAATDRKVLVIDLDPQGNASTGLGVMRSDRKSSSYHLLTGLCELDETVMETAIPNISLVPSTADLAAAELELAEMPRRACRLKDALEANGAASKFDYILIDCPPALGILTINAMTASNSLIVPLQCEFFALEGLTSLLKTVERVQASFNPDLEIEGIVLTMYDRRNNLSRQVAEDVREFLGAKVYETVIPRNVRVSEAPSFGVPALIYDQHCAGSKAYMGLAKELMKQNNIRVAA